MKPGGRLTDISMRSIAMLKNNFRWSGLCRARYRHPVA